MMTAQMVLPVPVQNAQMVLPVSSQFQLPYARPLYSMPSAVPTAVQSVPVQSLPVAVVSQATPVSMIPEVAPPVSQSLTSQFAITAMPMPALQVATSPVLKSTTLQAAAPPTPNTPTSPMEWTAQNPTRQPTTQISRRTSPLTSQRTGLGPSKVLNLVHLPLDTDVPQLERTLEKQVGCKVVRSLAAWNKASLLVELEELVRLPERRTPVGTCGVQALASRKKDVVAVPTSTVLNVRFYVLDPFQDYKGTEREREMHRRALRDFAGLCPAGFDMQLGAAMQESGRETWSEMASPLQPQRMLMAEGGKKLLYTQLFFVYDDEDMSTRAAALSDGSVHTVGNLRMVIRAEFSRPHAIDAAPRAWNPALWPRGGSAPEPYGPN
eukprot:Hpha_TRINITY_DN14324_c0_g1::TRINITY_DN14324_c0_g1_i3::g.87092::m.87092